MNIFRVVVRLGEHDLSKENEVQHIDIGVSRMIKHPNYDKADGHNDVAILVLEQPISFTGKTFDKFF